MQRSQVLDMERQTKKETKKPVETKKKPAKKKTTK